MKQSQILRKELESNGGALNTIPEHWSISYRQENSV